MTLNKTSSFPDLHFTISEAFDHFYNGYGQSVTVDSRYFMSSGPSANLDPSDFLSRYDFSKYSSIPIGGTGTFIEKATTYSYTNFGNNWIENSYVWGSTGYVWDGTISRQGEYQFTITATVKPYDENFDFTSNNWLEALPKELAEIISDSRAGFKKGITYKIIFDNSKLKKIVIKVDFKTMDWEKLGAQCFPASTPILTPSGTTPIEHIRTGDTVLAFDASADLGRGALVPARVTKLFRNTTREWIALEDAASGDSLISTLICTPGHHFLDEHGNFPTIAELLLRGGANGTSGVARIVLADGTVREMTGKRIVWSEDTAHLFGNTNWDARADELRSYNNPSGVDNDYGGGVAYRLAA